MRRRLLLALLLAPLSRAAADARAPLALSVQTSTCYQTDDQAAPGLEAALWREALRVCDRPVRAGELERLHPSPQVLELRGRFQCDRPSPPVASRFADAELALAGKVVQVAPAEPPRVMSEHAPLWQRATVQVAKVAKGDRSLRTVEVRFPGSDDVAWVGAPRFTVGEQATLLLRRDLAGHFTALDPSDVLPASAIDQLPR